MLRDGDNETEILLGNKQLLGIFFVVAVLLGIAFYGGYMVGKAAPAKRTVTAGSTSDTGTAPAAAATGSGNGGETHTISGETSTASDVNPTDATEPQPPSTAPPLGTPKSKKAQPVAHEAPAASAPEPSHTPASTNFNPEAGQQFLQVAAVGRDEALGVAHVLHAKGFQAHAVPKPGNPKVYRVLIGPLHDAGDLSTTRDALRRTGFREVIVQKY
jgi:cell division septation protein DedD